tara:strand:- start:735 stop:1643 length:909 start_codon:yes stop_codon:yes gene_type:complete
MNNQASTLELGTAITVPTISSSSFKVFICIRQWAGQKKDKRASVEVAQDNGAKQGTARVTKSLLGDCPELKAIQQLVGRVRNHHLYTYTLPWDDAGWRLLTTALMPKFFESMTSLQQEFTTLVDVFINAYHLEKVEAQIQLGNLYDPNDYPSEADLRAKFSFVIDKEPIAESGDWRVDVQQQAMADLQDDYQKRYTTKINSAMNDVWGKLHKTLSALSDRIDYGDNEPAKIFKATTVDNLLELVDLLDAFNITGDPTMAQMTVDLKNAMRGISPEALREDSGLRAETKKALDAAIKSLPSLN